MNPLPPKGGFGAVILIEFIFLFKDNTNLVPLKGLGVFI